jgi:hypothetical protein
VLFTERELGSQWGQLIEQCYGAAERIGIRVCFANRSASIEQKIQKLAARDCLTSSHTRVRRAHREKIADPKRIYITGGG